jgi:hypothetical protein
VDINGFTFRKKIVFSKWVFKQKTGANGTHIKHEARLVAKGCEQVEGLDYENMFVPVVKWGTLKALVALVAKYKWRLSYLNVKTTFLNGKLKEEVYIIQTKGFKVLGQEEKV